MKISNLVNSALKFKMILLWCAFHPMISPPLCAKTHVLFSPQQGSQAFQSIFQIIENAEKYIYITIYSWSEKDLALAIQKALSKGVKVKVILHPPLSRQKDLFSRFKLLEQLGAEFKVAPINMHEKFIIADGSVLINSSANFSNGAKSRYSESFIFHFLRPGEKDERDIRTILYRFNSEFIKLWNSSDDLITHDETVGNPMSDDIFFDDFSNGILFYSSSMNFTLRSYEFTTPFYQRGRFAQLVPEKIEGTRTWVVRDMLIEQINKAKKSILCGLNHLVIKEVAQALIDAAKRNVDVRLAVDNQEFSEAPSNKSYTEFFVKSWKKNFKTPPPVRVVFYSLNPSPRYWHLNHHKFLLIDFEESGIGTTLISGSYNISKTAEHAQFDNMAVYQDPLYIKIIQGFNSEFSRLWSLQRSLDDFPNHEALQVFLRPQNNFIPLHLKAPMALSFDEIIELRSKIKTIDVNILRGGFRKRDCFGYDLFNKRFVCP